MKVAQTHELIPVSALQHYSYCPRQCALIHVEQVFDENIYTLRGRMEHERVDEVGHSSRDGVRTERALPLFHDELGLIGRADAVEFHEDGEPLSIIPVEYKHGRRHKALHDDVQLCAQALCLEFMFETAITMGYVFHISSKKRRKVEFTSELRAQTMQAIERTRVLLSGIALPAPVADSRCRHCSLRDACLPDAIETYQRLEVEK